MQSSLIFLSLFLSVSVYTSEPDDGVDSGALADRTACPETLPVVDKAEVSPASLKSNYTEGDKLIYVCQQGYSSLGKNIYICNKNQWINSRSAKCSLKRCELPADIPDGRYILINGTDFVYGTTIKYICKEGYQMVSQVDTRTCLVGGWSNHLPHCEDISCIPPETERNVIVDGLPDYGTTLRYGYHIQFKCDSPGLKLVGPKEAICKVNGEWTTFPKCEEATCELGEISNGVSVVRRPDRNALIKYGQTLRFYCSDPQMALKGRNEVTCSTGGTWSSPFPTCEEITCREGELSNVRIVNGSPGTVPPFKPKHTLYFQCSSSSMFMTGPSVITCRADGTWNSPYPTCIEYGVCSPAPKVENAQLTTTAKGQYRHGETIKFTCNQYHTMLGSSEVTCDGGRWTGNLRCAKPCLLRIEDMDAKNILLPQAPRRSLYLIHGYSFEFKCQPRTRPRYNSVGFQQQCNDGVIHLPVCG